MRRSAIRIRGCSRRSKARRESLIFQSNAVPLEVRARAALRLTRFAGLGLNTAFFINTGAEANENALKLALRITGRRKVVAVEGSFHGRTAAAGAVTWGAAKKWYGFPQAPFDVEFVPRGDLAAIERIVGTDTAAVIVEPVQGVGGALDLGEPFLAALRKRCTETCALLIFDEVQCGMGRTGYPFAANMYGISPDMITTAKALGAGFPCAALLLADHVAGHLKLDDLGTTFGGGPMACAMIEAVVDIIESEGLLANVRKLSQQMRDTCVVGPVTGTQGAGFLLGLRTRRPAKDVQRELLEQHDILTGTSGDPHVVRILAPYVLESQHVEQLRDALALARVSAQRAATLHCRYRYPLTRPSPMQRFLDLADFPATKSWTCSRSPRACRTGPSRPRWPARFSACCS